MRDDGLFGGFAALDIATANVHFSGVVGGSGPPLLLLHGYPQTHAAWHAVAPTFAASHTVIAPDLPGYGASRILRDSVWDKREVASELVAMMNRLGHERFSIVAHDRGARAGYRLALDHPSSVLAYVSLAVVPTLEIWPALDREFAKDAFHWFLFLQPGDLVERLLASDPDAYLDETLRQMIGSLDRLHPAAVADYRAAFRKPSVRAAMIKDYRASYGSDTDNDAADRAARRRLKCPVLVLWANERLVAEGVTSDGATAVDVWRRWADDVSGFEVPGGHLIPEDASADVLRLVPPFLEAAENRSSEI
ncbi:Fluoroacetate dehalogenase [uncultured Mycobacterium sp.]|uniref:Fluoroacetate dehalogenase n=1 Tax=uncultured Mycobacterium sp. TaxID=171292 RepID=A0A1Y5PBI8_9MYCO|nr:Fluoroacetate dehalogenase [uncultured Mycobacterium sp.]